MANKIDRTKLLTQVFAARMPQLEAAVAANDAVTEAGDAVKSAEQHLADAVESYRQAYTDAANAGWTDVDLNAVGLTKPKRATAKPGRPASASETAGANNGSQPADTVI